MERSQFIFAVSVGVILLGLGGALSTINSIGVAHMVIGGVIITVSLLVKGKVNASDKVKDSTVLKPKMRNQRVREFQ